MKLLVNLLQSKREEETIEKLVLTYYHFTITHEEEKPGSGKKSYQTKHGLAETLRGLKERSSGWVGKRRHRLLSWCPRN